MPKRKISSAEGVVEEDPRGDWQGCWLSLLLQKVEMKPSKAAGKDKLWDRRVQAKGKRGVTVKQAKMAHQETEDVPAENGDAENEESPAFGEAEEKEAKSD
ncbi:non-histone chromosomal protein HMG-14-like [Lepus europaeus]|uniref:non-histone chromosomal protein HMG-14-like n=1 Tax=Lepus europaeus TaxID=9983 RepID=UPI002B49AEFF|nr:non-histone chromosomal protein HMG-14-like [Lepus europaeus]